LHLIKKLLFASLAFILLLAAVPITTEASTSFQTDLVDGLTTKSEKITFDLWTKDSFGKKIDKSEISVTNNGNPVPINWDDTEKTSYTLTLDVGINQISIAIREEQWQYTLYREDAYDGETIGYFTFSLDAFSLGLGYLIEPVQLPITKGRTASEELDAILRNNQFTYKSTGTLTSGFYLATIYKDNLYSQPIAIPDALKPALGGVYDEQDFSPATGLGEFDFNYMSGWMYAINNTFPNVGFSDKYLLDGDVMRVQFTLAYGQDIGGGSAMGDGSGGDYFMKVNKDELTRKIAQINSSGKDNYLINETRITAYTEALQTIAKIDATQGELDMALSQLQAADQVTTNDGTKSGEGNKAKQIISQIQALIDTEKLTLSHLVQVEAIRKAYDVLSIEAKSLVTNFTAFLEIEQKMAKLQQDEQKAIQTIIMKIDSLPTLITVENKPLIKEIRQAYDALTIEQKAKISNYSTLLAAERAAEKLQPTSAEQKAIQTITMKIDSLPTLITVENKPLIKEIRQAYDALTIEQQSKISNYSTLLAAERAAEKLQPALEDNEKTALIEGNVATFQLAENTFDIQISAETLQALYENKKVVTIAFEHSNGTKLSVTKKALQKANENNDLTVTVQLGTTGQDKQWQATFTGKTSFTIPIKLFVPNTIWNNGYLLEKTQATYKAVPHFEEQNMLTASVQSGVSYTYITKKTTFADIVNHANKQEIDYLANRYVIQGSDGLFNPNQSITRAQFAAMIARALGVTASQNTSFTDIQGQWYEQDVQALFEAGIVNGTTNTTFNPTAPLTRQHAAAMMARVLRYAGLDQSNSYTLAYQDASLIGKDYAADIAWLQELNIMSGSNGKFYPKNNLTRAQMAKILKRTLNTAKIM